MAAAPKRLPGHVTLVRPVLPPKSPAQPTVRLVPPKPTRIVASTAACAHIVIVPTNPAVDAGMIRHEPLPTHAMPIYAGRPACR